MKPDTFWQVFRRVGRMRADRLIRMLIALQHRGRLTAADLAAELEISVRTVLRDVDTLSAAGVPIYTVQGAGGGIELLDGFRTQLTGLTPAEASVMGLAGQPALAAALGVGPAAVAAYRKMRLALPTNANQASAATDLDSWFLHDPVGRDGAGRVGEQVARLARAIRARVEVRCGAEAFRPLALVLETGAWLLIHRVDDRPQLTPVSSLPGPLVLGRQFTRPADFDLSAYWRSLSG
jgi:predicted DNA-binding transcriptional regulator YafY